MRILHVIRSADPAGGGPIEAVTRLGLEHQRQGRHVTVVALDSPDAPWWRGFPLEWQALGPVRTKYGYTPRFLPWLHRHLAGFDIVVANGLWQYTSFAVRRASICTRKPYVVFPHGMLDPWFKRRYPLKHLKKWMYWPWGEYRVLRDAAAVMFTSEEERLLARRSFSLYRCREVVVGYGTAPPADDTNTQREQFMTAYPEVAGKRVILFIGRIHEKKGCDLLLRAFASVARSGGTDRPWHLVLAGPTPDLRLQRRLQDLIDRDCPSGSVTWTGMLAGDLKWGAFRAADVFALPSHQENFGVAVAEALACGVPVLISDKVNIWREIQQDGAGFVDADDVEGTHRLLERWITTDDRTRNHMRERARRCFATRFDAREAAGRMAAALDAVA